MLGGTWEANTRLCYCTFFCALLILQWTLSQSQVSSAVTTFKPANSRAILSGSRHLFFVLSAKSNRCKADSLGNRHLRWDRRKQHHGALQGWIDQLSDSFVCVAPPPSQCPNTTLKKRNQKWSNPAMCRDSTLVVLNANACWQQHKIKRKWHPPNTALQLAGLFTHYTTHSLSLVKSHVELSSMPI